MCVCVCVSMCVNRCVLVRLVEVIRGRCDAENALLAASALNFSDVCTCVRKRLCVYVGAFQSVCARISG